MKEVKNEGWRMKKCKVKGQHCDWIERDAGRYACMRMYRDEDGEVKLECCMRMIMMGAGAGAENVVRDRSGRGGRR